MALCVVKVSWMVFLLFSIGACLPAKQGQSGSGSGSRSGPGSGSGSAGFGYTSTGGSSVGSGSEGNLFDQQLATIARFIAEILSFGPSRPFPREAWTSEHVPVGSVEQRPLYPSSHVVKTSNGYQRARDFSSDAKYTQDIFDHMDVDGGKQGGASKTGSKGQKGY
ncbi:YEATS domain-containing protein 2-like isoform X2 [Oryzias latipes]|uniref:YEATS domain-containing protein 2-like isoform X2 n=1 Tax=Oryzias latipes TaxID=8090 RepID=UPI0000E9F787|nr:YEATS domain-containing protein 2-like isoform X2 [Oryzias latipes]